MKQSFDDTYFEPEQHEHHDVHLPGDHPIKDYMDYVERERKKSLTDES